MVKKKDKGNPVEEFFKSYSDADEAVNFQFGEDVFAPITDVISTSSLVLDDALSSGGLPRGKLIQYYGPSASGKTLMAMLSMRDAQKQDPTAIQFYLDAEQTFNNTWATQLGLDISKICVVNGESAAYGQKLFEMLLGIPKEDQKHKYVGKQKEGLLDKITNGDLNVNLIVLDSLGAVIVPGMDTARVGQVTMGKAPKFYTETFAKLSLEVNKSNVCFIVINHVKASMDPYGPSHTFSGGNAYTHHLSANVYFEAVNRKDSLILDEHENKIGGTIRAVVEKSKFGPHPRKCEFKVNFYEGVVEVSEQVADLAISYGVINQITSMSYEYGENKWVGKKKVVEAIESNDKLASELMEKITKARIEKGYKTTPAVAVKKLDESDDEEDSEED
jgi:recombination protein RecA